MHGRREGGGRGGRAEPRLAQDLAHEADVDHLEQFGAELEHGPEKPRERQSQGELETVAPSSLELLPVARRPAPLDLRRLEDVVCDEDRGGAEEEHLGGGPEAGRTTVAHQRLAPDVVGGEGCEQGRRRDRPAGEHQRPHPPDPGEHDQRRKAHHDGQGRE